MSTTTFNSMGTAAIHGTGKPTADNAHLTPIFATSTFTFDSAEQGMDRFSGKEPGYIYSRFGNPTCAVAEEIIAMLESFNLKDEHNEDLKLKALLHSSGQSAMTTMFMSNLSAGDAVLSNYSLYGGTFEFLNNLIKDFGISTVFTDLRKPDVAEDILRNNSSIKLIHLETPSNPTMQCVDIGAICRIAKKYNVKVTVDNTFATPYLQQPFQYGADFVFHSTTKFLNGHGSAIGGVLLGKDLEFMNGKVYRTYKLLGCNSNPFDAFLLIQGIKTLPVRMDRHCSNAIAVADFLSAHPAVEKVHYNGLPSHPDHAVSLKQMRQPGAVLSFELKDGFEKAKEFINALRLCILAVSLGTVDTLISHPASMSHAGMSKESRQASGITDGLIRMSVGLEYIQDIIDDLEQAL
jgi:methionine-gamma-lyase